MRWRPGYPGTVERPADPDAPESPPGPAPAPAPVAALREPADQLDPRVMRLWALEGLIGVAVLAGVAGVVLGLVTAFGDLGLPLLAWSLLVAAVVGGAILALTTPRLRYRMLRFEVTPLGLYVQRGWLWRSWTIVPHSRIQAVETTVGPLERVLGLATVEVRTASGEGSAAVPGLSQALVETLSAELAAAAGEGDGLTSPRAGLEPAPPAP